MIMKKIGLFESRDHENTRKVTTEKRVLKLSSHKEN